MMTIKRGARGDDVLTLQAALRALGHYLPPASIDGDFGPLTERAVRSYQASAGLTVDGIVGPKTWTRILSPQHPPFPSQRCWPMRCLKDGRKPEVSSGYRSRNPDRADHHGVDVMYRYRPDDPPVPINDGGRAKSWWVPAGTYAIAPFNGRVEIVGPSPSGIRVWLAHPRGWCAGFFHLEATALVEGDTLELGEFVGRVGHNPSKGVDPRHLHFEIVHGDIVDIVRRGQHKQKTVDPQLMLDVGTPYLPAV